MNDLLNWAKNNFSYDPDTGIVRRLRTIGPHKAGDSVGVLSERGYLRTQRCVGGRRVTIRVHRIAWALYYNEDPPKEIDHINRDKADNRIKNLRSATRSLNCGNRDMPVGVSGLRGVWKDGSKWRSGIIVKGKKIHLGMFECPAMASVTYELAWQNAWGCARTEPRPAA